jgi:NADH:ubiquinone oxidoreductase subunit E
MKKIKSLEQLEQFRKEIQAQRDPKKTVISICAGTGCLALGSKKIAGFKEEIQSQGLISKVELSSIKETGCPGFCERGPIVVIYP